MLTTRTGDISRNISYTCCSTGCAFSIRLRNLADRGGTAVVAVVYVVNFTGRHILVVLTSHINASAEILELASGRVWVQDPWPDQLLTRARSNTTGHYRQDNILETFIVSYCEVQRHNATAAALLLLLFCFDNLRSWDELTERGRNCLNMIRTSSNVILVAHI